MCKDLIGHEHPMEKIGLDLDEDSLNKLNSKQRNAQDAQKQLIQRCIQSLRHASDCKEEQCRQPSCMPFKKVMHHMDNCKQKSTGKCSLCKKIITLCSYHAKECNETECPIRYCSAIKNRLKQQQLAQSIKQEETLRCRLSFMLNDQAQSDSSQDK